MLLWFLHWGAQELNFCDLNNTGILLICVRRHTSCLGYQILSGGLQVCNSLFNPLYYFYPSPVDLHVLPVETACNIFCITSFLCGCGRRDVHTKVQDVIIFLFFFPFLPQSSQWVTKATIATTGTSNPHKSRIPTLPLRYSLFLSFLHIWREQRHSVMKIKQHPLLCHSKSSTLFFHPLYYILMWYLFTFVNPNPTSGHS